MGDLNWREGTSRPATFTGVGVPSGEERGSGWLAETTGGTVSDWAWGARFWLEPRGPMIELTCSPTLTQDPNRASASRRAIHERRSRPFRSLNAVAAPYAASAPTYKINSAFKLRKVLQICELPHRR